MHLWLIRFGFHQINQLPSSNDLSKERVLIIGWVLANTTKICYLFNEDK